MTRRLAALLVLVPLLAACGGGGSSSSGFPTIQAAKTFHLASFTPTAPVAPGKPVRVSFRIVQPDGTTLTRYRTGAGPHTGVHLIMVSRDLSTIVHLHPPIARDGTISTTATFPAPAPYRVVVDAYPATTGPQRNFQLFSSLRVKGPYRPQPIPRKSSFTVDGYRLTMKPHAQLHAIQAGFLTVTVTAPDGKPAHLTPWFGALAHAIFFREGTLDYFHTHVCAPGATACTSAVAGSRIVGKAAAPGVLRVGVLVPAAGTWRLFLQCKPGSRVITAPFTIDVKP